MRAKKKKAEPTGTGKSDSRLRIVAFSDYRVQDQSLLLAYVKALRPAPDLLIYAGDDVERFHNGSGNMFERLARAAKHGLCAVVGNDPVIGNEDAGPTRMAHEVKKARAFIRGRNVHNVHCHSLLADDYAIVGSEGAPNSDSFGGLGAVIYSERAIARHLRTAAKRLHRKHLIVVSHAPPRGVLDFGVRFSRDHIGSIALRKFICGQRDLPLVVCGHVHSCGAQTQKLGRTLIVNAASHDDYGAPGRVALIEMEAGKALSVEWRLLWELGSICGIREGREARLKNAGIGTVLQLAEADEVAVVKALKSSIEEAKVLKARASSFCQQRTVVNGRPVLSAGKRAYLDIETDLKGNLVWLVGVHVEDEDKSYAFYARAPRDERATLREAIEFLASKDDLNILSYSGSHFEERILRKRLAAHGLPTTVVDRISDTYFSIHSCAAFPAQRATLKDVAKCCGFKWREPEMNGFEAALRYGSGKLAKSDAQVLISYNEDDLLALKHVVLHLERLHLESAHESGTTPATGL